MNSIVRVKQLDHAAGLPLPCYESALAAGADICAALPDGPVELAPLQRAAVPTGLILAIPPTMEAQIRPRSGLALRHGLGLVNAPGTIDADFRGEVKILLINLGSAPIIIEHGMRIAQMVFADVTKVSFSPAEQLDDTARGSGGFGSTGH